MTFEFQLVSPDILPESVLDELKIGCQDAMAGAFAEICRENIGSEFGANRPSSWAPLSSRYARRVGRSEATLFLSGNLFNSIQVEVGNPEYASVFSDSGYGMAHQEGRPEANLPARPFFPITPNGELTLYAQERCMEAAENAAERILN